jgi:ankyrin repeat protein
LGDAPLGKEITGYFERLLSGDPQVEPWPSWWQKHARELRAKLSPGQFMRVKLAPHRELRELLERERRIRGELSPGPSLFDAIDEGSLDAVKNVVQSGVSVDSLDEEGESALYRAVGQGNLEIIGWLLDAGARDQRAWEAALMLPDSPASGQSSVPRVKQEIVEQFLRSGEDANALFEDHMTPLMHAARGSLELVALLLAHGAEVDAFDKSGLSPLAHAARSRRREVVELLAPLTDSEERERVAAERGFGG